MSWAEDLQHLSRHEMQERNVLMESLIQKINADIGNCSKSERRIANYIIANPDSLMVDTAAALARNVDVSPMTVSRFIRKMGFLSFAEARKYVRDKAYGVSQEIGHTIENRCLTFISDRIKVARRHTNLDSESAAIRQIYEMRETKAWRDSVAMLAGAGGVYVVGFQGVRSIAIGLTSQLEFVRPQVNLMDGQSGSYSQALTDPSAQTAVVIIDINPYSAHAPLLAKRSIEAGVEVTIVTDEFCEWARAITDRVLSVTTDTGLVFRSTTALTLLTNLITNDVIEILGPKAHEQMQKVAEGRRWFGQLIA